MRMGRGSVFRASPSAFRPFIPVTEDLRLGPMGTGELGSASSGAALGGSGILCTGLGFTQGAGVPWRNLAKGYLWVNLLDSQSWKGAETPGVTGTSVSLARKARLKLKSSPLTSWLPVKSAQQPERGF